MAWLASRLAQPKQDTVGEVWASDLRTRVSSALAEGRADEAVADARSVMAVNADIAPVGEPYLTARQMLVQALMQGGRHGEAVEELTRFIDAISTNRRKSGLLLMQCHSACCDPVGLPETSCLSGSVACGYWGASDAEPRST